MISLRNTSSFLLNIYHVLYWRQTYISKLLINGKTLNNRSTFMVTGSVGGWLRAEGAASTGAARGVGRSECQPASQRRVRALRAALHTNGAACPCVNKGGEEIPITQMTLTAK